MLFLMGNEGEKKLMWLNVYATTVIGRMVKITGTEAKFVWVLILTLFSWLYNNT